MKRVILLRHGKAASLALGGEDIERPLEPQGERESRQAGQTLLAKGVKVDRVLCSSAVRARSTCEIVCGELGIPQDQIHVQEDLYLASPDLLMETLCSLAERLDTVLIVGHNPGLSELAMSLYRPVGVMGTAGLVLVDFDVRHWSDLAGYPIPVKADWTNKPA